MDKVSIGLDIGRRHINMVRLERQAEGLRLLDFFSMPLDFKQGKEARRLKLEKIVKERDIAGSGVTIGVSGESVIVRYIDLPKMRKEEVGQALKYEAQQYIPFKIEEMVIDHHILDPLNVSKDRMKVLLVAAKRQAVTEAAEFIRQAGLKVNLIDVDSFSLINCFQFNGPKIKGEEIYALLNLEFGLVNMNILEGKIPFFTRDISLLEDMFSLPEGPQEGKNLFDLARPMLNNLIREIRLSIDYFESEFEKHVLTIYLSGEGATIPELIDFFKTQLGREINLWNPLQNLNKDLAQPGSLKQAQSMLALACGLALRTKYR